MLKLDQSSAELKRIVADLGLKNVETHAEQNGKWIHVVISCEDFREKSSGDRENLIWKEFERRFDDETILSITQCYLVTPEEHSKVLTGP